MKVSQSNQELMKQLKEQITFLQRSVKAYDAGYLEEHKRMATTIRILVHDTQKSTSLLKQLNKKDILLYDTGHDEGSKIPEKGVLMYKMPSLIFMELRTGSGVRYLPVFDKMPMKKVSFDEWWNKLQCKDGKRNTFTRKSIVLAVANQDGGAHIDALNKAYFGLSRKNSLGWISSDGKTTKEMDSPVPQMIRQIAHEVLKTLKNITT